MCIFFFKQKTAYEMRISDCSSDVCSSDLASTSGRLFEGFAMKIMSGNSNLPLARAIAGYLELRSEARRVGYECVSPCRSRWSPSYEKNDTQPACYSILSADYYVIALSYYFTFYHVLNLYYQLHLSC